jgi:hypothetical protein
VTIGNRNLFSQVEVATATPGRRIHHLSRFVTTRATDVEGNNADYSGIDQTPPSVAVTGVTIGATSTLSSVPAAGCTTSNSIRGRAPSLPCAPAPPTRQATRCPVSATYQVVYHFDGFLQPINDTTHQQICGTPCPLSIFNSGSTVPVKFQLEDANGDGVQRGNWSHGPITAQPVEKVACEAVGCIL